MRQPLFLSLLLVLAPAAWAETRYHCHLTLPDGRQVTGLLDSEVPDRSVTLRRADGTREGYTLTNGTKMWKEDFYPPEEKFALLAGGLSFFVPGLGQYYNGDETLAAIVGISAVTGMTVAVVGIADALLYDRSSGLAIGGLFLCVGAWSFGVGQAFIGSFDSNGKRDKMLYSQVPGSLPPPSLALGPQLGQGNLGLAVQLTF